MDKSRLWVIAGPTAAGKTAFAVRAAKKLDAEIVSADACQIFRGLPMLTAQPTAAERMTVRHHLVDILQPDEDFTAAEFSQCASEVIGEIQRRGKAVLVVGGSGFYLGALFNGMAVAPPPAAGLRAELAALPLAHLLDRLGEVDPAACGMIDRQNPRRVQRALEIVLTSGQPFSAFAPRKKEMPDGVVLFPGHAALRQRIEARSSAMLTNGAIEEVKRVSGASASCAQIIGIQDIRRLLGGEISREECLQRISSATWQYARRQMTWFRNQTPWSFCNLQEAEQRWEDWSRSARADEAARS